MWNSLNLIKEPKVPRSCHIVRYIIISISFFFVHALQYHPHPNATDSEAGRYVFPSLAEHESSFQLEFIEHEYRLQYHHQQYVQYLCLGIFVLDLEITFAYPERDRCSLFVS